MVASEITSASGRTLRHILRALRHRNYRLFFIGQGISLIGTWMQRVAVSWLVYRMTNSPFLLGLVGFSGQMPTFIMAPFAGALADRWDRMKILLVTQYLAMFQALALAVLVLTETVQVWHVVVLAIILGIINGFEIPTRQSLVVKMIDKREDLGNAIALNSSIFNGARLIGPTVAGILIALVGEGVCFLINGLSFVAVIAAIMAMRISDSKSVKKNAGMTEGLKEGFAYAFGFAPIRSILLLLSLLNFMAMPFTVLMPIFAKDILHGGPNTLGYLLGATGLGALTGAIFLAARKSVVGLGKWIAIAAIIMGSALAVFSISKNFILSLLLLYPTGFGMMVHMASSNTVLQTIVDDDKRARLMSLYAMSFMGMTPLGSLLAGTIAGRIGAPLTLAIGGMITVLGALIFMRKLPEMRKLVRPIYQQKGIISEVASGIQSATEASVPPRGISNF